MEFDVRKLLEKYENLGLKINLENRTLYMSCGAEAKNLILEDQKYCIRCKEFKYLGGKIHKADINEIILKLD